MILYWYIGKTIMAAVLLVLLVFCGLILFANLLSEMHQVGDGSYHFINALEYVLLTLPTGIYRIFPTIMLLGVLIGLGSLATHSELTVMRTSGLSLLKISTAVLLAGCILIVLMTLLGEGAAQKLGRYADTMKANARNQARAVSTFYGVWLKEGNDFFTIKMIENGEAISGVTRFHFDEHHHLLSASTAENGKKQKDGQWLFNNVNTSQIEKNQITVRHDTQSLWPLSFNLHQFSDIDPVYVNLLQLYHQLNIHGSDNNRQQLIVFSFWSRILQPLTTIIMILVAIPFIFGPLRSISIGLRLLSGVLVGLVFYILNQFLGQVGLVYQVSAFWTAAAIPSLFFILALFLFWRKG